MAYQTLTQAQLESLVASLLKGATVAQTTGISKDVLEGLYSIAYGHYSAGNFRDAHVVFQALTLYDNTDVRFWMGLAGCRQAMEKYESAIDAYQMAAVASLLKDPEPLYYASKCLMRLGRKEDAISGIEMLLKIGSDENPRYAACHKKAKALLELLQHGGQQ